MSTASGEGLLSRTEKAARHYCDLAAYWQKLQFRVRMTVLILGLATSSAGAILTSTGPSEALGMRFLRGLTVLLPLLAGLITVGLGTWNMARKWVAYRAAAETLKSEAFLHATGAEKYRGGNPDAVLEKRLKTIEAELVKQVGHKPQEVRP